MRTTRKWRVILSTAVAVSVMGCGARALHADVGRLDAAVAVSSDYVLYGRTRSQGDPVVQAQLGWAHDSGWSAGTWFSTVDYNDGPGISRELDFYLARRWSLGRDFAVHTELTQYTFNEPRTAPSQDYTELRAAVTYRQMLELSASVSPNYSFYYRDPHNGTYDWDAPLETGQTPQRTVLTYGAAVHLPATRHLSLHLGAGRFDMQRLAGRTYTYWSAGGELALGRFNLALDYIGTDSVARQVFGHDRTRDRFVATVAVRLP
jgi:uncharacterized protein (TIGR02001 family)